MKRSPRRRRGETTISRDASVVVPPLPQDRAWHDDTIAWWIAVWKTPIATMWLDSDNGAVVAYARLLDEWHRTENLDSASRLTAELRLRGEALGLTPAARARLGWKVEDENRAPARQRPAATDEDPRALLGNQGWPGNVTQLRRAAS